MSAVLPKWLKNQWVISAIAVVVLVCVGYGGYYLGQQSVPASPAAAAAGQQRAALKLPQGWERESPRQFDSWQLDCLKNPKGNQLCSLILRAVDKQNKQLVLALIVSANNQAQPLLTVVTPPGVILPKGVQLTFGTKELPAIPFVACAGRFCRAVAALNKDTVDALSTSDSVAVRFTVNSGRAVGLKLPTKGFADGYAAWQGTVPQHS